MKKTLFFLLFVSTFTFAQMPNVSKVWLNNSMPYTGTIGDQKEAMKVMV